MKKSDFDMFKITLNHNIEVDNSLRRISEKIRLLNQQRYIDCLAEVSTLLFDVDSRIDEVINTVCEDE